MLRELIPHGDQKRDKASFLLEVLGCLQILFVPFFYSNDNHLYIKDLWTKNWTSYAGYRVHSIFTRESGQIRGFIPGMESRTTKVDAMGKS